MFEMSIHIHVGCIIVGASHAIDHLHNQHLPMYTLNIATVNRALNAFVL